MKTDENYDTLAEIITVVSILIKFGFDEIIDDRTLLISFLNELGIRFKSRFITKSILFNLTQDITTYQRIKLIEEFESGFKNVQLFLQSRQNIPNL